MFAIPRNYNMNQLHGYEWSDEWDECKIICHAISYPGSMKYSLTDGNLMTFCLLATYTHSHYKLPISDTTAKGPILLLSQPWDHIHSVPPTREAMLRAFCFGNSAKQILLHRAGDPKPVRAGDPKPVHMWMREESKQKPRNLVHEWPEYRVGKSISNQVHTRHVKFLQ